ncbi:uncharacterized protein LOC121377287 [Gigantopelta aegis]|uniref:uncharacterized protein LOC121377287 n=1 Tax=Gigantopelta aegis TaxID=1735272 RepID=UPI001B88ABC6|nr:uncharacterized protein LOC121377287 [Gigantopelta aegis]
MFPHTNTENGSSTDAHTNRQQEGSFPVAPTNRQQGDPSTVAHTNRQTDGRPIVEHTPTDIKTDSLQLHTPTDSKKDVPCLHTPTDSKKDVLFLHTPIDTKKTVQCLHIPINSKIIPCLYTPTDSKTSFSSLHTPTDTNTSVSSLHTPTGSKTSVSYLRIPIDSRNAVPCLQSSIVRTKAVPSLRTPTGSKTDAPQHRTPTGRLKDRLKHTLTFTAQTSSDETGVDVNSILVLQRKTTRLVVVSDWLNKSVKCFSCETAALVSRFDLPCHPCGLAGPSDEQTAVLVALPLQKRILYLDIQDGFRLTHTLKTSRIYYFIFPMTGKRLVASGWRLGGYVDILNSAGQVIKTFPPGMFPDPWSLTVRKHTLIVISKKGQVVACLTPTGLITWIPCDPETKRHLVGVACDADEFIYLCDALRNCVVKVTHDGRFRHDVLTQDVGLATPVAICCHLNEVYVAQSNGNVSIFTCTKS